RSAKAIVGSCHGKSSSTAGGSTAGAGGVDAATAGVGAGCAAVVPPCVPTIPAKKPLSQARCAAEKGALSGRTGATAATRAAGLMPGDVVAVVMLITPLVYLTSTEAAKLVVRVSRDEILEGLLRPGAVIQVRLEQPFQHGRGVSRHDIAEQLPGDRPAAAVA